jgi:hypothetical protein
MTASAMTDSVRVTKVDSDGTTVTVRDTESYWLHPVTACVLRHAVGQTNVQQMANLISDELQIEVDEETVRCAFDCLSEAGILTGFNLPPAAARRDLLRRLAPHSTRTAFTASQRPTTIQRRKTLVAGDDDGKRQEEARKQEEGGKERNREYQQKDAQRIQEYNGKEQANKQEQNAKRG